MQIACTSASVAAWASGRRVPTIELARRIERLAGIPIAAWVEVAREGEPTDDYTQGVTSEELERLFDTLSKASAEGSEGSEATSRLVPHESHNKALTANALQTLQTLQPSTGSPQNHSPATPAAGSPTPNGSGGNGPPATPSASLLTTLFGTAAGGAAPLSAVPWNGRAVNDTCNEREPEADDDPGAESRRRVRSVPA